MSKYQDGREFDNGDTKKIDGVLMEVHAVRYKEDAQGNKYDFEYDWITKAQADEFRKSEADHALEVESAGNE